MSCNMNMNNNTGCNMNRNMGRNNNYNMNRNTGNMSFTANKRNSGGNCSMNRNGYNVNGQMNRNYQMNRNGVAGNYQMNRNYDNGTASCPVKECTNGCDIGTKPVDSMTLAMSYVPWQEWKDVYCFEEALERGTIFEELDKPFLGRPIK